MAKQVEDGPSFQEVEDDQTLVLRSRHQVAAVWMEGNLVKKREKRFRSCVTSFRSDFFFYFRHQKLLTPKPRISARLLKN